MYFIMKAFDSKKNVCSIDTYMHAIQKIYKNCRCNIRKIAFSFFVNVFFYGANTKNRFIVVNRFAII